MVFYVDGTHQSIHRRNSDLPAHWDFVEDPCCRNPTWNPVYAVLQANRIYSKILAQCLVGDVLGRTGQDVVRAFFQMFVLGIGVGIAALAQF